MRLRLVQQRVALVGRWMQKPNFPPQIALAILPLEWCSCRRRRLPSLPLILLVYVLCGVLLVCLCFGDIWVHAVNETLLCCVLHMSPNFLSSLALLCKPSPPSLTGVVWAVKSLRHGSAGDIGTVPPLVFLPGRQQPWTSYQRPRNPLPNPLERNVVSLGSHYF
jgi:hypothetical protein